ncbi:MAG TPA: enoyl-CoA hydratase-related protein [Steroidobacteraceae bacterium]|nr:enoyl-CoA hydratase-related protein [Steroidobacteraceae bacterium]
MPAVHVTSSVAGRVLRIAMARPEKKNALTGAMYLALAAAIAAGEADPAVRVLLLHGAPDVFTAGNDIEDFLRDARKSIGPDTPAVQFIRALSGATKPVVAAVQGAAVGIGTTLLMHCELVYCAEDASFIMPFVSLGLCSEFASALTMTLAAGYHKAAEKLLLAEPISAAEALEMRIVNRVLPGGQVLAFAQRQADRLAALPPNSVRETKRLMKQAWRAQLDAALRDDLGTVARLLGSPEATEAFQAFLQKRTPDFSQFD